MVKADWRIAFGELLLASAKKRTQWNNLMTTLNQGDKVVVTKLFTLADSTRHLVEL